MISDEGQLNAACIMREAAEANLRAAYEFSEAVTRLQHLLGQGYGTNLDALIEQLTLLNAKKDTV